MTKKLQVIPAETRRQRADRCTETLVTFEASFKCWPKFGKELAECEADELWKELDCESWEDWVDKYAPISKRACYAVKRRWLILSPHIPLPQLVTMLPETAEYASRNLSKESLQDPKVREALQEPKRKAVALLKAALPAEHLEHEEKLTCKFAASALEAGQDAFECYKFLSDDEKATWADFIEAMWAEWMEGIYQLQTSSGPANMTRREFWEVHKRLQDAAVVREEIREHADNG